MANDFQHIGVYGGMAPLNDEAFASLATRNNEFLAEMMKRRDARAWEQAQAIDAARNAPTFPTVPGSSPQANFQNLMVQALTNSWKSGNPAAQKWAAQGFESVMKDISGNTVMTQEQKNAFGAAPNDARAAEELIRRQIDPSFALNVASNNRLKETGYEYGQKRGFENLQLGNKKDFAGFEQGLKGFGTAPLANGTTTTTTQKTNGKLTKPEMALQILETLKTKIDNKTVDDLLKESTGSGIGAHVDQFNRYLGTTTPSAQAASQLETLSGWITSLVPRFEGPQSDYDVQNYKIMAGKLGDRTVPYEEKLKALQVLKSLSRRIAGIDDNSGATGSWGEAETTSIDDEKERAYQEYLKQNGQ